MYFELSKLDAQAAEPFYILARIAVRNDKGNFKGIHAESLRKNYL